MGDHFNRSIYWLEGCIDGLDEMGCTVLSPHLHENIFPMGGWDEIPVDNLIAKYEDVLFHNPS
ncbi:MAG TPA: hypothetical protein DCK95_00175 [Anaerolineaceae bacterium]|nr:hypothetical protein [Anaerolineaceae bacterium]